MNMDDVKDKFADIVDTIYSWLFNDIITIPVVVMVVGFFWFMDFFFTDISQRHEAFRQKCAQEIHGTFIESERGGAMCVPPNIHDTSLHI